MWEKIKKINPVWYFDATGSILKNLPDQNKTFFYSIVCHDTSTKTIIPVAEFASTCQKSRTISKYLFSIKKLLENGLNNLHNDIIIAPLIVVDFSWPLINSVLEIFNNSSTINYINWAFDIIHLFPENKKLNNYMNVRLILCHTHLFAGIVKDANNLLNVRSEKKKNEDKTNQKVNPNIKRLFLFCFTLLQNSISVNEFDEFLNHTFNIFCVKYETLKINNSIQAVEKKIIERNIDIFKMHNFDSINHQKRSAVSDIDTDIYINVDYCKSIKNESKFGIYYENLIKARMLEESKTKSQELKIINQYFFPELFSLIHKKLHLVPLWTGILIKQCQNNMLEKNQIQSTEPFLNITRLTNNPVENYFGHIKNNILMKKKNLMPSEVLGPIYQNLKSKYYQFYDSVSNVQETKLFDRKMNFSDVKEIWTDKKRKFKREKSFYYKSTLTSIEDEKHDIRSISINNVNNC